MILILLAVLVLLFLKAKYKELFQKIVNLFLICTVLLLVISIIFFPKEALQSARSGVDTWFHIVLPSLLPFFIGAELLIRLGVVHFIGVLLEPVVRPVFNVPGEGSFVLAMSLTSGYPVGVKLASKLRKEGIFTREEAQRIISFCSTSGPLFMLGAVSAGMFHNLQLGVIIVLAHYLGAFATGIIFRFYPSNGLAKNNMTQRSSNFSSAFQELSRATARQKKPFGLLLGESVRESVETLLAVGGFIILFSVIIRLLTILKVISFLSSLLQPIWLFFHINKDIQQGIISGIFEITIGCKLISEVQNISFLQQAVITTMIISWSGFSIHAQAASMINSTDVSVMIYICSKLLHAILSALFALFLVPFYQFSFYQSNMPVFLHPGAHSAIGTWKDKILFSSELFIAITVTIIIFSIFVHIFHSKCMKIFHKKNKE